MPRGERRRWWLEQDRGEGWVLRNANTEMRRRMRTEMPEDRTIVSLWRLVQWLRIRLERALLVIDEWRHQSHGEPLECYVRGKCAAGPSLAAADSAVLEARCAEERMREERDDLERKLWEFYGDGD
jgi:hypothetical protein